MGEAEYALILNMTVRIEIFLHACCMAAFFYPFMVKQSAQGKHKLKKVLVVAMIYAVMYFINASTSVYGWVCMGIVLVVLAAVSKCLDMDRKFTLFLGVVFFSCKNLSLLIMRSLVYFLNKSLENRTYTAEDIYQSAAMQFVFIVAVQMLLFSGMLYILGLLLRRMPRKGRWRLHAKELCYLILIPVMGILFVNIIFRILLIVNGNQVFQLYDQFPVFLGIVPAVAALFYIGIFVTILSYQKMTGLQEEKEIYFLEQQQIHAIQERMEEVDRFYDSIRQMKHEMRNHLTNIKGLVKSGSYDEIGQYIERMDEGMNAFELTIRTGNAVTDVIVNDKKNAAQKQGIPFRTEFLYPQADGYSAYDIGIIVNNLLQNALEACEKMTGTTNERYIYLSGRQKNKFYLIQVRNSFEGEVAWDTDTMLPLSSKGELSDRGRFSSRGNFSSKGDFSTVKREAFLHGIGLSNVKQVVEQYMGDIDIGIEEGKTARSKEFRVTVLLQER